MVHAKDQKTMKDYAAFSAVYRSLDDQRRLPDRVITSRAEKLRRAEARARRGVDMHSVVDLVEDPDSIFAVNCHEGNAQEDEVIGAYVPDSEAHLGFVPDPQMDCYD